MRRILVAGASGTLGREVIPKLRDAGWWIRALSRRPDRLGAVANAVDDVVVGDLAAPVGLGRACAGVDVVLSCAGASLSLDPRDRTPYGRIDDLGNRGLLEHARTAGVGRFVYVSLYGARTMRHLEYPNAHERFVDALAASGISYAVVRPTAFFSFLGQLLDAARKGVGVVIGRGDARINPVHEADVAEQVVRAIDGAAPEIAVGGPETYTRRELSALPFAVLDRRPRLVQVPPAVMSAATALLRPVNPRLHALMAFGIHASQVECVAPAVGARNLRTYFAELAGDSERRAA